MTAPDLAGRTALVTGASRGIGLAIARALIDAGARVAMLARGADELSARAAELGAARALALPCDVADAAAVTRAVDAVRAAFGGAPDVLVNNAGLYRPEPVAETTPADFTAALDINLVAPFRFVRAFVAGMRDRGSGHVVTIGSIADRMIYPDNAAYAASKFGVRALHSVVRAELRGTGVRATLVSPGPVDTPIWDAVEARGRAPGTPRARMLRADAVADAVRFAVTRPPDVNIDELRLTRS